MTKATTVDISVEDYAALCEKATEYIEKIKENRSALIKWMKVNESPAKYFLRRYKKYTWWELFQKETRYSFMSILEWWISDKKESGYEFPNSDKVEYYSFRSVERNITHPNELVKRHGQKVTIDAKLLEDIEALFNYMEK